MKVISKNRNVEFDEGRHFGEEVGEMVGKSTNCRIWHCLLTISTDTTNYRGVRLMLRTSGRTVTSSPQIKSEMTLYMHFLPYHSYLQNRMHSTPGIRSQTKTGCHWLCQQPQCQWIHFYRNIIVPSGVAEKANAGTLFPPDFEILNPRTDGGRYQNTRPS